MIDVQGLHQHLVDPPPLEGLPQGSQHSYISHVNVPATPARPAAPMGYYGQSNQFAFMPNPHWITEREHMLQQQLLLERQQCAAT